MTTTATNEPSVRTGSDDNALDPDYATYLRVRNGISNEALRAAGLPPARDLTYDAYRQAFGAGKQRPSSPAVAEEPIAPPVAAEQLAPPVAERPAPPSRGRRLILDEAADGTWRIVAGPDHLERAPEPPPSGALAKVVAMTMGLATAFVIAATINAVFLHQAPWRLAADVAPPLAPAGAGQGKDAVAIEEATKPNRIGDGGMVDDATGDDATGDDATGDDATGDDATGDDGRPAATQAPPRLDPQIDTASGGTAATPAPSAPLPAVTVATKVAQPVPAPVSAPQPPKARPIDLPKSTPTARDMRLPNSTKPASAP